MKYIIFEDGAGIEQPIIFNPINNHDWMAHRFPTHWKVISAGKLRFLNNGINCTSGSVSLGTKFSWERSDADEKIIKKLNDLFS
jgi:hypothetical protein